MERASTTYIPGGGSCGSLGDDCRDLTAFYMTRLMAMTFGAKKGFSKWRRADRPTKHTPRLRRRHEAA